MRKLKAQLNSCKSRMEADQPDLRLNREGSAEAKGTHAAGGTDTESATAVRQWAFGPNNQKQIILPKLRRGEHRDVRASSEKEGEGEERGKAKKRNREWRAGEKTTLTALLLACSVIAERSEPRLSRPRGQCGQRADARIISVRGSMSCAREWARRKGGDR